MVAHTRVHHYVLLDHLEALQRGIVARRRLSGLGRAVKTCRLDADAETDRLDTDWQRRHVLDTLKLGRRIVPEANAVGDAAVDLQLDVLRTLLAVLHLQLEDAGSRLAVGARGDGALAEAGLGDAAGEHSLWRDGVAHGRLVGWLESLSCQKIDFSDAYFLLVFALFNSSLHSKLPKTS